MNYNITSSELSSALPDLAQYQKVEKLTGFQPPCRHSLTQKSLESKLLGDGQGEGGLGHFCVNVR